MRREQIEPCTLWKRLPRSTILILKVVWLSGIKEAQSRVKQMATKTSELRFVVDSDGSLLIFQ